MSPSEVSDRIRSLRRGVPTLHWGRLRYIGNIRALTVSFITGLVIALPDLLGTDIKAYLKNPAILWLGAVFVVGMSLAYLIYEFFCPEIVKRFENLPDFYEHQLNIKKLQKEIYPKDPFDANLLHVTEHYTRDLGKYPAARYVTLILYISSFVALLLLLGKLYNII